MTNSVLSLKEVAGITIPDTALAKAATLIAYETSHDFLYNHALRTYLYGFMAGKKLNMKFDQELFYVSSILHDLGLTENYEAEERFEIDGADAAKEFCEKHNVSPERTEIVWDAIALHSTPGIAPRKGPEATLVQIGAGTDVMGFGEELIGLDDIRKVINEVPREEFSKKFIGLIIEIAKRKPKQHAFTWVSEMGNQCHGHGFPCPKYSDLLPRWASLTEADSH